MLDKAARVLSQAPEIHIIMSIYKFKSQEDNWIRKVDTVWKKNNNQCYFHLEAVEIMIFKQILIY